MFSLLPLDLEETLRALTNQPVGSPANYVDFTLLDELQSRGYIKDVTHYMVGDSSYNITYKGRHYFQEKQRAIDAGQLLDNKALSLLSAVASACDSNGGYACSADDTYAIRTLRIFGAKRLVEYIEADDIPYWTTITNLGRYALAHDGQLTEPREDCMNNTSQITNINIGGDSNAPIQSQQGTVNSTQTASSSSDDIDKLLDQIISLADSPEFNETFGNRASTIQTLAMQARTENGSMKSKIFDWVKEIISDSVKDLLVTNIPAAIMLLLHAIGVM